MKTHSTSLITQVLMWNCMKIYWMANRMNVSAERWKEEIKMSIFIIKGNIYKKCWLYLLLAESRPRSHCYILVVILFCGYLAQFFYKNWEYYYRSSAQIAPFCEILVLSMQCFKILLLRVHTDPFYINFVNIHFSFVGVLAVMKYADP